MEYLDALLHPCDTWRWWRLHHILFLARNHHGLNQTKLTVLTFLASMFFFSVLHRFLWEEWSDFFLQPSNTYKSRDSILNRFTMVIRTVCLVLLLTSMLVITTQTETPPGMQQKIMKKGIYRTVYKRVSKYTQTFIYPKPVKSLLWTNSWFLFLQITTLVLYESPFYPLFRWLRRITNNKLFITQNSKQHLTIKGAKRHFIIFSGIYTLPKIYCYE